MWNYWLYFVVSTLDWMIELRWHSKQIKEDGKRGEKRGKGATEACQKKIAGMREKRCRRCVCVRLSTWILVHFHRNRSETGALSSETDRSLFLSICSISPTHTLCVRVPVTFQKYSVTPSATESTDTAQVSSWSIDDAEYKTEAEDGEPQSQRVSHCWWKEGIYVHNCVNYRPLV